MTAIKTLLAGLAALCAMQAHADPAYSIANPSGSYGLPAAYTLSGAGGIAFGSNDNHAMPVGLAAGDPYLFISAGGSITIDVNAPTFNLLWGTPDSYNYVSFDTTLGTFTYDGARLVQDFSLAPLDTQVFTASLAGGTIRSVTLSSGDTAFEFAVSAVPEPQTYALMAAGLALVGVAARRRRV